MDDDRVKVLTHAFRKALCKAQRRKMFPKGSILYSFPVGCCDMASTLLSYYLLNHGVPTIIVSAKISDDISHTWLVVKDNRIKEPICRTNKSENELSLIALIWEYGMDDSTEQEDQWIFTKEELKEGLIVDITADQFLGFCTGEYVGFMNDFYNNTLNMEARAIDVLSLENNIPMDSNYLNYYNIIMSQLE